MTRSVRGDRHSRCLQFVQKFLNHQAAISGPATGLPCPQKLTLCSSRRMSYGGVLPATPKEIGCGLSGLLAVTRRLDRQGAADNQVARL